jgi:hypothetical protein
MHEAEWAGLRLESRLSMKLVPLLWSEPRFAPHKELLLRLMVQVEC